MKPISPPIIQRPATETMAAYDALPCELRQAVAHSPISFDVVDILTRWKAGTNQSRIVQRMARQAAAVERLRR